MSESITAQPGPLDSCGPDIADMLCEEIMKRKQFGLDKYGKPLRTNNGRKALIDLLAELLDACHYTLQELLEREALVKKLHEAADQMDREQPGNHFSAGSGLRMAACIVGGNHPEGCS